MPQRDGSTGAARIGGRFTYALAGLGLAGLALVLSCGDSTGPDGPGEPATVEILDGQGQNGVVGKELPQALSVRVVDAEGRAVPGAIITFRVVQGGGSVFAESVVSNSEGIAQNRWTLGTSTAQPQRVEVRGINGETGEAIVFATFTATPQADVATALAKVSGDEQRAVAGTAAPDALAVRATDQYNNPVPGVTINWTMAEGSGSANPAASVTDATGIARTSWVLGGSGPQRATASFAGLANPVLFSATITSAAAASMSIYDGDNRTVLIESVSGTPPTVLIRDAFGNPVAGVEVTFAVTSGGGSLSATTGTSDEAGHARSGAWTLGGELGTNTVSATAPGLSGSPLTFTATGLGFIVENIDVGGEHSCAVALGGAGYCWGANQFGQLGDDTNASKSKPTRVSGNLTFKTIQGGEYFSCGLTTAGTLFCWGSNPYGQLGVGTTGEPIPEPVSGGMTFQSLAVGQVHACALTSAGAAYCWGWNVAGQLGNGDTDNRSTPTPVSGGLTFKHIGAGYTHTCGITTTDAMYCWGSSYRGQLGNGDSSTEPTNWPTPQPVLGGLTFKALALGKLGVGGSSSAGSHTCGLTLAGKAYCWGSNRNRALGNGSGPDAGSPEAVDGGLTFETIAAGPGGTCAAQASGTGYCWGLPTIGTDGNPRTQPTLVPRGISWDAIASGDYLHNCGRASNGVAYCWGHNSAGQTATEITRVTPGPVRLP